MDNSKPEIYIELIKISFLRQVVRPDTTIYPSPGGEW